MLTPAIRAKRVVLLRLRFRSARTFFHNTARAVNPAIRTSNSEGPQGDSTAGRRAIWGFPLPVKGAGRALNQPKGQHSPGPIRKTEAAHQRTRGLGGSWVGPSLSRPDASRCGRSAPFRRKIVEDGLIPGLFVHLAGQTKGVLHTPVDIGDLHAVRQDSAIQRGSPSTTTTAHTLPMAVNRPPWSTSTQPKPISRCRT